jgi:hypothetical protein
MELMDQILLLQVLLQQLVVVVAVTLQGLLLMVVLADQAVAVEVLVAVYLPEVLVQQDKEMLGEAMLTQVGIQEVVEAALEKQDKMHNLLLLPEKAVTAFHLLLADLQ